MTLAGYLAYAGALAVAVAIPGPGITAVVARALGSGFSAAFAMSLGLVVGDLVWLTAVVAGLAILAQTFGMAFLVIKWAGVAYLVYLAWKFWRDGIGTENVKAKRGAGGFATNLLAGLTLTLGNPKTMVFYMAIAPTVIDLKNVTLADYGVLVLISIVVLLAVLVPYLVLAAKARGFLQSPRGLKVLSRGAAMFMFGAAAAIAARQ